MANIQNKNTDVNENSPFMVGLYDLFTMLGTVLTEGYSYLLSVMFAIPFVVQNTHPGQKAFYVRLFLGICLGSIFDLAKNFAILWLIVNKPQIEYLRVYPKRRIKANTSDIIKMGYLVKNSYESFEADWFITAWLKKFSTNFYRGLLSWLSDKRWIFIIMVIGTGFFSVMASRAEFMKENQEMARNSTEYKTIDSSVGSRSDRIGSIDEMIKKNTNQIDENLATLRKLNSQGSKWASERQRLDEQKNFIRNDNARLNAENMRLDTEKSKLMDDIDSKRSSQQNIEKKASTYNNLILSIVEVLAFFGINVSHDFAVFLFALCLEFIGGMFWIAWGEGSASSLHDWLVYRVKAKNMANKSEISNQASILVTNINSSVNKFSQVISTETSQALKQMETVSRNMEMLYENMTMMHSKMTNPALLGASSSPSPKMGYEEFKKYVGEKYFVGLPPAIIDQINFQLQFIGEIFDENDPAIKKILQILNDFRQNRIGFRLDAQPGFSGENKMLPDPDFREPENQGDGTLILGRKSGLDASRKSGSSENQGFSRKSGFPENQGTDQGVNQGSDNPENQGKNPADLMAYGQAIKEQKAKAREDMVTKLFRSKKYTYAQIGVMIPKNIGGPLKADSVSKIIRRLNLK